MEFVLKPTQLCNFKCSYCSSEHIAKKSIIDLDCVLKYIDLLGGIKGHSNIVVNGGDPLTLEPQFYLSMLDKIHKNNYDIDILIVSNMYDFYKHPDKWNTVFSDNNVSLCMSFEYGTERKSKDGMIADETYFLNVFHKIRELYNGYKISFISVVTKDNYDNSIKSVQLAKKLDTQCRLNGVVSVGRSEETIPLYNMLDLYKKIVEQGLQDYEMNTRYLIRLLRGEKVNACGYTRTCYLGLRCLNTDGVLHNCGMLSDLDIQDKGKYRLNDFNHQLNLAKTEMYAIKPECGSCPWFMVCNGCFAKIRHYKKDVPDHCEQMKKRLHYIKYFSSASISISAEEDS